MSAMLRRNLILICTLLSIISLAAALRADNSIQVAQGSGTLVAPGYYKQAYQISPIDTSKYPNGGTLQINITMGSGISSGSFDVFPANIKPPMDGPPTGTLGGAYDISPGSKSSITIQFAKGQNQIFQFGATGNWFSPVPSSNTYSFTAFVTPNAPPPPDVTISTPYNGAFPRSNYVALTGTGPVNSTVLILLDDSPVIGDANVDGDGVWEKTILTGPGLHTLAVENAANSQDVSNTISVIAEPSPSSPRTITDYTLLKKADIFLTRGFESPQVDLYGSGVDFTSFQYTHTALYLGGDNSGTPMVAEAVPDKEGGVRAVPIEMSTVYTDGILVDIYRPKSLLNNSQRSNIVSWAKNVTNKGIPYWTNKGDFLVFGYAWNRWNLVTDAPFQGGVMQFNNALKGLNDRKYATDRFICSTLVWHSYYAGTNQTLDLSVPNHVNPQGLIGRIMTNKLVETLQPYFVFPDTIASDGLLRKVN